MANKAAYVMILPVVVYYLLFCYKPMYGALIAFQNYSPRLGFWGSPWVGFENFTKFFNSPDIGRIVKNTVKISLTSLIFGFPAPIILALLINEINSKPFKRVIQTTSYMPHFISLVVICGMVRNFVSTDGIITNLFSVFGFEKSDMLTKAELFVPIYVSTEIWQNIGWDSIIYLSALSAVDVAQYEAAEVDGAGRIKKMLYITFPSILPTVLTMLILRTGQIMNVGFEKIILLYNPVIYSSSDVISSYVYRLGFETQDWSYSTAVGLFNSVINLLMVIMVNRVCKKTKGTGLW